MILTKRESNIILLWITMISIAIACSIAVPIIFSEKDQSTTKEILIVMLKMFYYSVAMLSIPILTLIIATIFNHINPIITGMTILVSVAILLYVTEIKLRGNKKMIRDPMRSLYT